MSHFPLIANKHTRHMDIHVSLILLDGLGSVV